MEEAIARAMFGWDGSIPVNIEEIAAKFRVDAGHFNFHEDELRRRFAIAHAIGHKLLGHSSETLICGAGCFSKNIINNQERLANQFALELLIPTRSLEYLVNVVGVPGTNKVQSLSRIFGVSEVAVYIRLKQIFPDIF